MTAPFITANNMAAEGGLPEAGAAPDGKPGNLRLAGWLLPAPEGRIRILLQDADLCLEFPDDGIEAISSPQLDKETSGQPVAAVVELRRGAALLQIGPGAPWRSMLQMHPRPFRTLGAATQAGDVRAPRPSHT